MLDKYSSNPAHHHSHHIPTTSRQAYNFSSCQWKIFLFGFIHVRESTLLLHVVEIFVMFYYSKGDSKTYR